jgi:lipopolysaccharide/colanic/teichoic acid biosynthesis glycosyltransferase
MSDEPVVLAWTGVMPSDATIAPAETARAEGPVRSAPQSGLPLRWSPDGPLLPEPSLGRTMSLIAKRVMDIVLSLAALIFLAPLLLVVALVVRFNTRGSVLFTQSRAGLHGKPFRTYKFRTMHADLSDPTGRQQTRRGDKRITPVGHFLRRFSIDELPQLLNVLRGDMSIVGPRPHVPGMLAAGVAYEELVPYYDYRYLMKPGLSGWAQAQGFRGPTDDPIVARARINHDIAYIQNFSLLLDVWIILLTLKSEFVNGSGV